MWVVDPAHLRVHVYRHEDEPLVLNSGEKFASSALVGLEIETRDLFYLI